MRDCFIGRRADGCADSFRDVYLAAHQAGTHRPDADPAHRDGDARPLGSHADAKLPRQRGVCRRCDDPRQHEFREGRSVHQNVEVAKLWNMRLERIYRCLRLRRTDERARYDSRS